MDLRSELDNISEMTSAKQMMNANRCCKCTGAAFLLPKCQGKGGNAAQIQIPLQQQWKSIIGCVS